MKLENTIKNEREILKQLSRYPLWFWEKKGYAHSKANLIIIKEGNCLVNSPYIKALDMRKKILMEKHMSNEEKELESMMLKQTIYEHELEYAVSSEDIKMLQQKLTIIDKRISYIRMYYSHIYKILEDRFYEISNRYSLGALKALK